MDFNALFQAIKCCLAEKKPVKGTAKAYGVHRSTLQRYVKKVAGQFDDISSVEDGVLLEFVHNCSKRTPSNMVFSPAQEKDLVQYILKRDNHYYGLSSNELRELAYQFAKKLALDCPAFWDKEHMAGRHWYSNFMRRHSEVVLRSPEQTSIHRFSKSTPEKSFGLHKIDFNALLQAIKCCLADKTPIKGTAEAFGISRGTLQRYIKKVMRQFDDISSVQDGVLLEFVHNCGQRTPSNMVFNTAQEKDLVQYILKCVNHYYGLSINELRKLAYQFAKKLAVDYPENWDEIQMAGRRWYKNFMRRHSELVLRSPEQTCSHRMEAFCRTKVDIFFQNFSQLIDKHHFEATHIYNMNESGFPTASTKLGDVIALKRTRHFGKRQVAERGTMITMALTVNAAGNSIPPFFLFPRKTLQKKFLDNVSSGTVGFANGSDWMCAPEFERYIRHLVVCVKPTKASPILLLLDNQSSYLSIQAIDFAVVNGVHILSFPPYCSYKLQPLDVSVFGPLKTCYNSQCVAWQKNNANKVLEIHHITGLVCETLDLALTSEIIKSGFRATGISPFNPDIFSDSDFVQAVEQNKLEAVYEVVVDKEDQRQIVMLGSDVGRQEVVFTTPEPSTSRVSSAPLTSRASLTSCLSLLEEIDPLQAATPKKLSNRGRKPMQSSALPSPECIASLKKKASKRAAKLPDMHASVSSQKKRRTLTKRSTKRTKATPSKPSAKSAKA